MLRAILLTLLLAAAAVVALWQFDVIDLPLGDGSLARQPEVPDIHAAAAAAQVPELLTALEAGTPPDSRTEDGATPLMLAASASAGVSVLNLLLEAGADVNATDNAGLTPLLHAARETRQPDAVLLLLNAGADPTHRSPAGDSAATLAAANPTLNATRLLPRLQELENGPYDPDWPSGY